MDVVHFIPKAAIFYAPDWTFFLATEEWASMPDMLIHGAEGAGLSTKQLGLFEELVLLLKGTASRRATAQILLLVCQSHPTVLSPGSPPPGVLAFR